MDAQAAVDRVWRADAAGMLGVLTRRLGDFGRAEDALQDALAEALRRWPVDGVPDSPAGWLVTTAWRRALDGLRREATGRDKLATRLVTEAPAGEPTDEDRLALIFGCCHPELPVSAQVPLTLRAVCGLSTAEIAAAYLVPEATMAQRLVRARRVLADRQVPFDLPDPDEYPTRLPAVLAVVYLVFNEGYLASGPTTPQRRDLAREAVGLARQLAVLMPGEPEVAGPAAGLAEVEALGERLSGYRLFHATRAELLRACGRTAEAHAATGRALALATNPAERELLARRLAG